MTMKLKNVSQISISGGCEVHAEGRISLVPLTNGMITVRVDNSGHHFYDEPSDIIPSFDIDVYPEQVSPFIETCVDHIDSVRKTADFFSTRDAVVGADLSLQDRHVRFSGSENRDGYQLDPLITAIDAFVVSCYRELNPTVSFSPKNRTDAFLGRSEEREKAVIQFSDLNGLHGGIVIVLTGAGTVMVQHVSPEGEPHGLWEKRYVFTVSPGRTGDILNGIVDNDVLTVELPDRPGVPDETRIHFSMTNGENKVFTLETWEASSLLPGQDHPRVRFDRACLGLKQLGSLALSEKEPVQEGPFPP